MSLSALPSHRCEKPFMKCQMFIKKKRLPIVPTVTGGLRQMGLLEVLLFHSYGEK